MGGQPIEAAPILPVLALVTLRHIPHANDHGAQHLRVQLPLLLVTRDYLPLRIHDSFITD